MTVTAHKSGRIIFDAVTNTTAGEEYTVLGFNWSGASNSDILVVDDESDVVIFNAVSNTGQLEINFALPKPLTVSQIKVSTIGGGVLIVYVDN